ncbi:sporulation membrane protein YtrI [Alteribacillus sp. HJP-4]|uniref:sporulation membrane protein YtrI n=1 Tax=Alteribacillus sp. HJP-4 TaxID=2775394 RepID=UPI0035CD0453
MRIPPYYRKPGWQRFFAGVAIGTLAGWAFFIFQFGAIHEELVVDLNKQRLLIAEQHEQIDLLREAEQAKNQENERKLTIQDVSITFTNEKSSKLNELALYELKQEAESEMHLLKNKNIESAVEGKELIKRTIENKTYTSGDKQYKLKIEEMYIYTMLELYVRIEAAE